MFVFIGVFISVAAPVFATTVLNMGKDAGAGVTFEKTDGPAVTLGETVEFTNENPWAQADRITLEPWGYFESDGSSAVQVDRINGTWTNTSALDVGSADLTININDKQPVTVGGGADSLDYRDMALDDGQADFAISSSAPVTLDVEGFSSGTRVVAVDGSTAVGGGVVDSSGTLTLTLTQGTHDSVELVTSAGGPSVDSISPTGGLSDAPTTLTVDVSDPDFPADNVSVTARFDGTEIATKHATAAGEVTFDVSSLAWTGGSHTWTVEVADASGQTATETETVSVPSTLTVRNETNVSEVISGPNVTVRLEFFGDEGTVETRTGSNGTIDMTGLPADERYIARVEAPGYVTRTVIIPSIFEQDSIYLLNESVNSVAVEFEIDDSTGQFSGDGVRLRIDKPIETNGTTEYEAVAGARQSASGTVSAVLEEDRVYRIVVSKDGNTRSLGEWTATRDGLVTLPIGRIELSGDVSDKGWLLEHSIDDPPEGSNKDGLLRLKFVDKDSRTDSIETQVVRLNESGAVVETVLANATETDTQSFVRSVGVNNTSDTFELRYTLVRDGETTSGKRELGTLQGISLPVDAGWLNLISWVTVFAFGGLIVIKDSRSAALVMAGSASLFAMLGWLQAPTAVLALAAGGAVVYAVAGRGGGF
jgi:hypothetical protein